jgi:hypothetical protein
MKRLYRKNETTPKAKSRVGSGDSTEIKVDSTISDHETSLKELDDTDGKRPVASRDSTERKEKKHRASNEAALDQETPPNYRPNGATSKSKAVSG